MSSSAAGRPRLRRKACDLCFNKKIKCDRLEPECSNCLLYNAECQTSPDRNKQDVPKPKPFGVVKKSKSPSQRSVEKHLDDVIEGVRTAHSEASSANSTVSSSTADNTGWRFDPVAPTLYHGPPDEPEPSLPPLDEIIPVIDHYFQTANQAMPLFDQNSVMRMVTGWYNEGKPRRDNISWVVILVVISLGLHSLPPDFECRSPGGKAELQSRCLRNAQSAVPSLVFRDEDLLGVQVLTGLSLALYRSGDWRPSSVLISSALRLAHRLQLNSSSFKDNFTIAETQERSRVFWVLYVLDKDLSLRAKTPSMQADWDVDIPLPSTSPSDRAGLVFSQDGLSEFPYFSFRAELASIQGQVYDLLFSTSALKIQPLERQESVTKMQTRLDEWYSRIPAPFTMENVYATVATPTLTAMTSLYHSYLFCLICTHGVYSQHAEWRKRVSSLSRAAIEDFAAALTGPRVVACGEKQNPPRPDAWNHCVDVGRKAMTLFHQTRATESLLWDCNCCHFSALIIILANALVSPAHQSMAGDINLVTRSIEVFNGLIPLFRTPAYSALKRVIMDLHDGASEAVRQAGQNNIGDMPNGSLDAPNGNLGLVDYLAGDGLFQFTDVQLKDFDLNSTMNPFEVDNQFPLLEDASSVF